MRAENAHESLAVFSRGELIEWGIEVPWRHAQDKYLHSNAIIAEHI